MGKALVIKLWPLLFKRAELDLRLTNTIYTRFNLMRGKLLQKFLL